MRRLARPRTMLVVLAVVGALALASRVPAIGTGPARIWGQVQQVPGTAALNSGGFSSVTSASCSSAGDCAAGGQYSDARHHIQAYVVSEVRGRWHAAIEVPGLAALNTGAAQVNSVSCAATACTAGGFYTAPGDHPRGFTVTEVNGVWGRAFPIRVAPALRGRSGGRSLEPGQGGAGCGRAEHRRRCGTELALLRRAG